MTASVVSPPLIADDRSLAERLIAPFADLPEDERAAAFDALMADLGPTEAALLLSWEGQARPSQLIGKRWEEWAEAHPEQVARLVEAMWILLCGGRQSGKTRAGAEFILDRIEADELRHGAFVSRTPGDVRDVMIEGPDSGLMVCAERRGIKILHEPSKRKIDIVDGGRISTYSAQEPDQTRGPQHDTAWLDEVFAWPPKRDAMGNTAWTNIKAGLSLGNKPIGIATSTPRAVPLLREILTDTTGDWRTIRMTTWANAANVAAAYLGSLRRTFGGTRLARQEFEGEWISDVDGALWSTAMIEATRVHLEVGETWRDQFDERLWVRYLAVDPSVAKDGGGDECGIIGGGVGLDRRLYVIGDWSGHLSPRDWAQKSVRAYYDIGAACVVAEGNQGGALISEALHAVDPTVPVEIVHASQAKRARAEPIAALWQAEEGMEPLASFVGSFPELEAECTGWDANTMASPNRLDALVWMANRCLGHLHEPSASWSATATPRRLPV